MMSSSSNKYYYGYNLDILFSVAVGDGDFVLPSNGPMPHHVRYLGDRERETAMSKMEGKVSILTLFILKRAATPVVS